jgi:uncharacterized protein YndB with AHSA1/START domain
MTITLTLRDEDRGTRLEAVHEGLPPRLPAADNELGWQQVLARLAGLVEGRAVPGRGALPHSGP